ncbi:MAG: TolC family outer membrane protein [Magnetococcales bacterium]|nr:TolC family outer membrane protein [Magnetococcales bacterium]
MSNKKITAPCVRPVTGCRGVGMAWVRRPLLMLSLVGVVAPVLPAAAETLLEAATLALKANPEAMTALENRRAIRHQIAGAKAGYLPTLDVAAGYGREWSNNTTTRGLGHDGLTLTNGQSSATVSQMLFDGGITSASVAKARAAYASASHGYRRVAETVLQSATDVYLETLKQQELSALLEANVQLHEEILEKIEAKFKSGAGNEADVQQTQTRLALAAANKAATQGVLRTTEARYLRVVGLSPDQLSRPDVRFDALPKNWKEAETATLQSHPGVLAAQQDLEAARRDLEIIKGAFLPNVKMELLYGNNANQSGTEGYAQNLSAMLKMNYNLFRGGGDNARKHETLQRTLQMQQVLEQARRTVRETLKTNWEGLETSRNRLGFLEKHVAISTKVSAAYHDQFKMGKRTLLDVLNSETELFTAKSTLSTEQINFMASAFRLMASMGKLQEFLGIQNPAADLEIPPPPAETPTRTQTSTPANEPKPGVEEKGSPAPHVEEKRSLAPRKAERLVARVNVPELHLRAKSHANSPVLKMLAQDEPLQVQESQKGWLRVVDRNGQEGWVSTHLVR